MEHSFKSVRHEKEQSNSLFRFAYTSRFKENNLYNDTDKTPYVSSKKSSNSSDADRMSTTMLSVALILLVVTCAPTLAQWSCPENCTCGRSPKGEDYAQCPSSGDVFVISSFLPRNFLVLSCTKWMGKYDFGLLKEFNIGQVQSVGFRNCPLPDKPYLNLLNSMNVTNAVKLSIQYYNFSNTLEQRHLSGLTHIKRLFLNAIGFANVPEDLLKDMANLVTLDLRNNEGLTLPPKFFNYVPKLETLELGNNQISDLRPGLFQDLSRLKMLNLWSNRLLNLTRDSFSGLSTLESLDLSINGMLKLQEDTFQDLGKLKLVSLNANNFKELPGTLFRGNPMLESFHLHENRQILKMFPAGLLANLTSLQGVYMHRSSIEILPEDLFWGSTELINITLYGNKLTELPARLFRDATKLLELDLSSNKIQDLPDGVFSSLYKLRVLRLGKNRLTTLNQYLFASLVKLETLDLEHNALSTTARAFERLVNLQEASLSHNKLSFSDSMALFSPFRNCVKMRNLRLANNSIQSIFSDWSLTMSELKLLDLRYNNFSFLMVDDFRFTSEHITLDLRHNNIRNINLYGADQLIRAWGYNSNEPARDVKILIEDNPMQCDCNAYFFARYLEYKVDPMLHIMFNIVPDNLICASPPDFAGIPVTRIKSEKLSCEVNSCPERCSCHMRPHDKALLVDCTNRGLTEPPRWLPPTNKLFNHTELWLVGNGLINLPDVSWPGYANVTLVDASYNNLGSVNISQLPPGLKTLKLNHNNLTHMNTPVLEFLTNRTTNISLHGNPWSCDCQNRDMLAFLQAQFKQINQLGNVTCNGVENHTFTELKADDICPGHSGLIVATSTTLAVAGILLGTLAALYYRYNREVKVWLYAKNIFLWFVTEEELDKDKLYDAFISYSHKDEDFVVNELVPGLENGPAPFKLCLHFRDWVAGEFIPTQIARSVDDSRRTLVVLSPNFLESVWGRMEFRTAHKQALSEGRARVILLVYGDVGPIDSLDPELKAYLSMNTYVKWGDPWFWDKLRYALPHRFKDHKISGNTNKGVLNDKMELVYPSNGLSATTPPAEIIINPMLIIGDKEKAKLNDHINFKRDTNDYIKSV
uniref:TIR domain-containing protein n=1 Tax=Timema tahoe TaxID=61484 RepID=A0A7R9IGR7_9NEOP|nr:unnamed protein product [Timema tahoe]